ncbi:pilus assembly protein TadG-related protein [Teichococcus wenyumeiae]|uniref:pilus assembly protein TadG-related protein n=1 Tax=Teichococcus wenyumeiae TaxID=2478470 RepID=UPI001314BB7C|nr:pilus assembly protein TadG-related protein [Pseudoroseomonas wenyumeiae]
MLFAVSATALLGAVALITDGGLVYLTQRRVQSATDAAAIAAASAAGTRSSTAALAAATEVVALNGFTTDAETTVLIRNPPASGPYMSNGQAYEVTIHRRQPMALAAALFGMSDSNIGARSVAVLKGQMQVCLLALNGTTRIHSFNKFEARGCAIGANATGSKAVQIENSGSFSAQGVVTAGNCDGCTNPNVKLTEGYQEQVPPISNPYAQLDKLVPPDPPCTTNATINFNSTTRMPRYEQSHTAFCNKAYSVGNDNTVLLDAGTYIFRNASLSLGGATEIRCNGCTFVLVGTGTGMAASFTAANLNRFLCDNCSIVLLGSHPGQVTFGSLSTARLTAPTTNLYNSVLNGMIITRANAGATGSSGNPTLNLSNLNSIDLLGGIYVPNGYARISNMTAPNPSTCLPVVAGSLEVSQLNNFPFDVSGCPSRNTPVPQVMVPRLVE